MEDLLYFRYVVYPWLRVVGFGAWFWWKLRGLPAVTAVDFQKLQEMNEQEKAGDPS